MLSHNNRKKTDVEAFFGQVKTDKKLQDCFCDEPAETAVFVFLYLIRTEKDTKTVGSARGLFITSLSSVLRSGLTIG